MDFPSFSIILFAIIIMLLYIKNLYYKLCILLFIDQYNELIAFHFAEGDPEEAASYSLPSSVVLDSARRTEPDGDLLFNSFQWTRPSRSPWKFSILTLAVYSINFSLSYLEKSSSDEDPSALDNNELSYTLYNGCISLHSSSFSSQRKWNRSDTEYHQSDIVRFIGT
jgi:hypothetical protein